MRRIASVTIGVGCLVSSFHGPAHAEPLGTVEVRVEVSHQLALDGSYVAVAACRALALGVEFEVVPAATEVTCTAATASRTAALPGPVVATAVTTQTSAPVEYCASGKAVFVDLATDDLFEVVATPHCVTFPG